MTTDRLTELRAAIVAEHVARLSDASSPLVTDPAMLHQLTAQTTRTIDRALDAVAMSPRQADGAEQTFHDSAANMGDTRARQQLHPMDSLRAAGLLFEAALDVCGTSPEANVDPVLFARALHAAIMSTLIPASTAYVDVLLERLAVAHREERRALSRDLHDRVAHGIAAGLQRLQLEKEQRPVTNARLTEAIDALSDALEQTRSLALELRQSVDDRDLEAAVRGYLEDLQDGGPRPQLVVEVTGSPHALPAGVREEAFIVIREAVRNARRHADASTIRVEFRWTARGLQLVVADDGHGFDRAAIRPGALGLIVAQERAELIGGRLTIDTEPGRGTTVVLELATSGRRS